MSEPGKLIQSESLTTGDKSGSLTIGCFYPTFPTRLLWENVRTIHAFADIGENELKHIVDWLLQTNMLGQINGQLIIGVDGEYVVNSKDFYTVFKTEPAYKILHQEKAIGEMPFSQQLAIDENILLAARIWKIIDIDHKATKISVVPASDGRKPVFS